MCRFSLMWFLTVIQLFQTTLQNSSKFTFKAHKDYKEFYLKGKNQNIMMQKSNSSYTEQLEIYIYTKEIIYNICFIMDSDMYIKG